MALLPTKAQVQSGTVTNAQQKTYFGDMLDFLLALLGSDSSDKTAARAALQVPPEAARADVASVAGTVNLTTGATSTDDIRITGALAITGFTVRVGRVLRVVASGAFVLTNNANIVTNTGANITAAAGDSFMLRATAANTVEVINYTRAIPTSIVSATAQATTSGTAIDFTGAPSSAKRATMLFNGVSTSGTSLLVMVLGTSGGFETSGYLGSSSQISNGVSPIVSNFTNNILVEGGANAGAIRHGAITISLLGSNTWAITGNIGRSDVAVNQVIGGVKTLAGVLDRIRLTTAGGTDTFDAGSVNVIYES